MNKVLFVSLCIAALPAHGMLRSIFPAITYKLKKPLFHSSAHYPYHNMNEQMLAQQRKRLEQEYHRTHKQLENPPQKEKQPLTMPRCNECNEPKSLYAHNTYLCDDCDE